MTRMPGGGGLHPMDAQNLQAAAVVRVIADSEAKIIEYYYRHSPV